MTAVRVPEQHIAVFDGSGSGKDRVAAPRRALHLALPTALMVTMGLVLSGCTAPVPERTDLAGTFTDTDGGTLVLHDDGGYELAGVPVNVIDGEDAVGSTEEPDLSGAWDLLTPDAGAAVIMLDVGEDSGTYPYGNVQIWIGSVDRLYVYPNGVDRGPLHYFDRTT